MILVTGFGPFLDVSDNASGRLVQALDGRRVAGHTIVSRILAVSYARGPAEAVAVAKVLQPHFVLGFGVHRKGHCAVETVGHNHVGSSEDVDGEPPEDLGPGPKTLMSMVNTALLADCLGAQVSESAGSYVCNAWLYTLLRDCPSPAVFVHIPRTYTDIQGMLTGLRRFVAGGAR